jgi:hypothetical protein
MKKSILLNVFSICLLMYSVFLMFTANQAVAQSVAAPPAQYAQNRNFQKTSWKVINDSLTDLLDDGWNLIDTSVYRMATVTTGGVGAFDDTSYNYTLSKGKKYVMCFISNPSATSGASSGCRLLN